MEERTRQNAILLFRTQSPRHFEGGDWDQGGSCKRSQPLSPQEVTFIYNVNDYHQILILHLLMELLITFQVEELFSIRNNGTNVETRLVNQHLHKALKGTKFRVMDITHMSEFRADAHPSTAGGKKHDDCMHWCLPGITDTWNDLFIAYLNNLVT